jgi:NAD(P)H-dependent flavin oxidoreductase YrpB (nitropropane dioxygenase family)
MAISTNLTLRLGIEHPVMLAPMGFISGGALAAGYADPDWLEREFAAAAVARRSPIHQGTCGSAKLGRAQGGHIQGTDGDSRCP